MLGILLAVLSGALMSVQGVFNTGITKETSVWVSSSFVQATALLVCLFAWWITGMESSFSALLQVRSKYMLLGGVLGAGITYTVIQSVASIGPARSAMIIILSQLIVAYMLELFGLFGVQRVAFEWRKCIGVVVILCGIILFQSKSK